MFTPTIEKVHEDARGEIYVVTLPGDKELVLLHSKEGSLRGGHAHDVDETVVLLTGKMRYYKENGIGEYNTVMEEGTPSFNPAGEYHMGEFLEDSWVLEWKINTNKTGWKNIDHKEWRERVKANAGLASSIV